MRLQMCAERINRRHMDYSLLDVGCRSMELKPLLKGCRQYYGTDLIPSAGVLQCNAEGPLPFKDGEFDVVTALDVLEHLNNPHGALKEICRIARKSVFISLPNMYYIQFRWKYMTGYLSDKYRFPAHPVDDRHHWIMSYSEAVNFVVENTRPHAVEFDVIPPPVRGRTRLVVTPAEQWLAPRWPNLFAYGVLFEIAISGSDGG